MGVDVSGDDVGLRLITRDFGGCSCVIDRVEHVEQLDRLVPAAELRDRHHGPQGGVCVLATIFANAGHIALDVARIEWRLVEGWRQQLDEIGIPPHELGANGVHGSLCAAQRAHSREHSPTLGDRIDAALGKLCGTERRTVVEVGAAVPRAIPCLLDHQGDAIPLAPPAGGAVGIAAPLDHAGKIAQDLRQEPAQPHAFAAALMTDAIHAVVPIARSDERQPVGANGQSALDGADAVLVKGAALPRHLGLAIILELAGCQGRCFEERQPLIEQRDVAAAGQVMCDGKRKPQEVVRTAAAHAAARVGVPPMLDVAFDELASRTAQDVLPVEGGSREPEGHYILELVAEAVRSPRLVEPRASPHP